MDSLRKKATSAVLWSIVEKGISTVGQLTIGLVLANLLDPNDYGLLGMLAIFIAVSRSIVESGMASGLIQKQDLKEIDFSTVFVFNLAISLFLYLFLFSISPFVSDFYEEPSLTLLLKVLSLLLIISSFSIVQRAKLTIELNFKDIAKIKVASIAIGGTIAIWMAYSGYGIWALIAQLLITEFISMIMFWYFGKWSPMISFSYQSFKELFGFGSKLLISTLYSQILVNIYGVFIGKYYNSTQLGFYTNGKKYPEFAVASLSSVLEQVTFPILSKIQTETDRLKALYQKIYKMTCFVIFPTITLLFLLANPLVTLILQPKWQPIIPLIQAFCLVVVFYPISMVSLNVLKAIGRSDLFLKVNLWKAPLYIVSLALTIPLGLKTIILVQAVVSLLSFVINTYYPGKLLKYGLTKHVKDAFPFIVLTSLMAVSVYGSIIYIDSPLLKIIVGSTVGALSYIALCHVRKIEEMKEMQTLLMSVLSKFNKK